MSGPAPGVGQPAPFPSGETAKWTILRYGNRRSGRSTVYVGVRRISVAKHFQGDFGIRQKSSPALTSLRQLQYRVPGFRRLFHFTRKTNLKLQTNRSRDTEALESCKNCTQSALLSQYAGNITSLLFIFLVVYTLLQGETSRNNVKRFLKCVQTNFCSNEPNHRQLSQNNYSA